MMRRLATSVLRERGRSRVLRPRTVPRLYLLSDWAYGNVALNAITTVGVRAWKVEMVERGVGASMIHDALALLTASFLWELSQDRSRVGTNRAAFVKNPSVDPSGGLRVLEADELAPRRRPRLTESRT
jgi:hypothetical protein